MFSKPMQIFRAANNIRLSSFSQTCALIVATILGIVVSTKVSGVELVPDREITVHSTKEAKEKRAALIKYLWGPEGFRKNRFPTSVSTNVMTPVHHLTHLVRVDELKIDMAPGLQGLTY